MTIKIDSKRYNYVVNGTVGLTFLVEQMTDEPFEIQNKKHLMYLTFVVLKTSNPDAEEITLDWFLPRMTSSMLADMTKYITSRWVELEGNKKDDEPKANKGCKKKD